MKTISAWPGRLRIEQALQWAEQRLADAPADAAIRFERACLLDRLGRSADARQAFLDVLALDMRHGAAFRQLAALLSREGFTTAARTVLMQAVLCNPADAAACASLGHLLREAGEHEAAQAQYLAALRIEPAQPEAHQGLSYLLETADEAAAERHRRAGFAGRVLTSGTFRGDRPPVVVLKLVSARGGNIATRHLLDDRLFLTHTLVVDYAQPGLTLPPYDVVLNAIGDPERCAEALGIAEHLLGRLHRPGSRPSAIFNRLERIRQTSRAGNAQRLGRLEGVIAPRLATVPRAALANGPPAPFGFPLLLRSPGFHTGQHFIRVECAAELTPAIGSLPGDSLTVIEPLDAFGADGFARKYRVMIAGGALLPLHLAVSPHWKVHHFTSDMQARPQHRAEEAAFLADMAGVLGGGPMAALQRIRNALGLDFGGIDFAVAATGELLLFEANATMTVVPPVPGSIWDYRADAVQSVIRSVQDDLLRRAGRTDATGRKRSGAVLA